MPPKREYIDTQIKHKVKAPNNAQNDERTGDTFNTGASKKCGVPRETLFYKVSGRAAKSPRNINNIRRRE